MTKRQAISKLLLAEIAAQLAAYRAAFDRASDELVDGSPATNHAMRRARAAIALATPAEGERT